jgi:hypothetical protein
VAGASPSRDSYSPERRTVLVLSGTGADGAYHAGVLRALDEAGVKVDIAAGRGIGAAGAVFAAIGGSSRLWDRPGLWRSGSAVRWYGWRWPIQLVWAFLSLLVAVLLAPLLLVVVGLALYPAGLVLGMAGLDAGALLMSAYTNWMAGLLEPSGLPRWLARLVTLAALGTGGALLAGSALAWWRTPLRRRLLGNRAWLLVGAPLDLAPVIQDITRHLWDLLRGGAALGVPQPADLSRRCVELLQENLGQPEFRELLLVVHDLDARRDLVFGLVRDPFRRPLFPAPGAPSERGPEAFDLAGLARDRLVDVLSAALDVTGLTETPRIGFPADTYWRGEIHRLTDRPASLARLLEEAAAAGAEQAIVVSAAPGAPAAHELRPPRADVRGRLSEYAAANETAALRDALGYVAQRFRSFYLIRPSYNPIRPFDLAGAHDERSDRRQSLEESMERGYEDAYRQFIEPVVGASGERIAGISRDSSD